MNKTLDIYKETLLLTLKVVFKNLILLPATFLLMFGFAVIAIVLSSLGFVGAILLNIAALCFLTIFYGWIAVIVRDKKITRKELTNFEAEMFFSILNSGFYIWLALFIYGSMTKGIENQFVTMCISLFIGVVFNPLSEIIIYERLQGVEALKRSYFFITEKWLAWFIPFVVFLIPIIGFQYEKALTVLIGFDPIFSFMSLMRPWLIDVNLNDPSFIVTAICAIVFSVWYCIFRVFLYSELLKRG